MSPTDQSTGPGTGGFRVSGLSTRTPTTFSLRPDAAARAAIARELDILAIRKLTFDGRITASGKRGWTLEGTLGATVEQACVVTLAPVVSRIDEPVLRRFMPPEQVFNAEEGSETEMPEDDTSEPLGDVISPEAVMTEALALALPLYPRAPGAELGEAVYTEDGAQPLRDADLKPFAGLAGLRDRMDGKD